MKKLKALSLSLLLSSIAICQENALVKGDVEIDLGVGAGIYSGYSNVDFHSGVAAIPVNLDFRLRYMPEQDIFIGLSTRGTNFPVEKDTTTEFVSASMGSINFNVGYYFVNRAKFAAYTGVGVGFSGLEYEIVNKFGDTGYFSAQATNFMFEIGLKKYFNDWFGIYLEGDYFIVPLQMNSLTINDEDQEYHDGKKVNDVKLNLHGIDVEFGFTFNF